MRNIHFDDSIYREYSELKHEHSQNENLGIGFFFCSLRGNPINYRMCENVQNTGKEIN